MSYPSSWRRGRPSLTGARGVAAAIGGAFAPAVRGAGTWYFPTRPPLRPGRWTPGLFIGGLLIDALWQGRKEWVARFDGTRPFPSTAGWTHVCGPFPHPGYPYDFTVHWTQWVPSICISPIGGQAFGAGFIDHTMVAAWNELGFCWKHIELADRYYVYLQYKKTVPMATPMAVRAVAPVTVLAIPGVTPDAPPLGVPEIVPIPVRLSGLIGAYPDFPDRPNRGYRPPAIPFPQALPKPVDRAHLRFGSVAAAPPKPWDVEKKYSSTSRMGQVLTTWFRTLSFWGAANSSVDAFWRSLPRHAQTRHARTSQKYKDVFYGFSEIGLGDAYANALGYWSQYKLAGILYGTAGRALSSSLGAGPGFGLYRAAATGEYAYGTSRRGSYNPDRLVDSPSHGYYPGHRRRISDRARNRRRRA